MSNQSLHQPLRLTMLTRSPWTISWTCLHLILLQNDLFQATMWPKKGNSIRTYLLLSWMESLCKVRRSQREAQGRPVSQHGPRHQVAPGKNPRALLLMKPRMVFPLMIKLLIRKQINRSVVFAEKNNLASWVVPVRKPFPLPCLFKMRLRRFWSSRGPALQRSHGLMGYIHVLINN